MAGVDNAQDVQLIEGIRAALAEAGDADVAAGQQRYMKSEMPYHGIRSPEMRRIMRERLAGYAPVERVRHEWVVRTLWDGATHREQWYAAIAVARHPGARAFLDPAGLPLLEHLITAGAWWDVVDEVAIHLVGPTLRGHREAVTPTIDAWAHDGDLWLRRTAVICQVGAKRETDVALLHRVVEANLASTSFWLRKAIGWALRDHARTDPDWVRDFVQHRGEAMSGLSRREALKRLGPVPPTS